MLGDLGFIPDLKIVKDIIGVATEAISVVNVELIYLLDIYRRNTPLGELLLGGERSLQGLSNDNLGLSNDNLGLCNGNLELSDMLEFIKDYNNVLKKFEIDQKLSVTLATMINEKFSTNIPVVNSANIKTDEQYNNLIDQFIEQTETPELKAILQNLKQKQNNYNYESNVELIRELETFVQFLNIPESLKILLMETINTTKIFEENVRELDPFFNSNVSLTDQNKLFERIRNNEVIIKTFALYENNDILTINSEIISDDCFPGPDTFVYEGNGNENPKFINIFIFQNFILSEYIKGDDELDLFEKCLKLDVDEDKVVLYCKLKLTLMRMMGNIVNNNTISLTMQIYLPVTLFIFLTCYIVLVEKFVLLRTRKIVFRINFFIICSFLCSLKEQIQRSHL